MDYATIEIQTGAAPRPFHYRQGSCDEAVIKQIFGDHDYALNRLARFPEILQHLERRRSATGLRPLILDAGANIGASSVYFALNFPDAVTIAVEPDLSNFQLLARNASGLDIEPQLAAVAAERGRMKVVDPGESFWGFRTERVGEGEAAAGMEVPSQPVNDIYASCAARCFPFIAKIDIEGGEGDLFRANTEWVAATPVLIIELHDWMLPKQGTSANFLRCIAGLDRDFVHYGENVFSIAHDLDGLASLAA
jgi:FkbM family methyltransferase